MNRGGHLILYGVATLVLGSGCSTSRPAPAEAVVVPDRFSTSGVAAAPEAWWGTFGDPGLNQLVERALQANLNLRAVWDRLDQARAVAAREGAASRPTLNAQGGVAQREQRAENPGTGEQATTSQTSYSAGLAASYELDLWGRIRSLQDAAAFDLGVATQDVQAAAISLTAEIAATWYQRIEAQGQVRLLREQWATNQGLLELIELRFQQGQVGATDVLQQRRIVEARSGEVANAEAAVAALGHRLNVLTGTVPGSPQPPPPAGFPPLPPLPETGLPADLMQRRPDVQRAYLQVLAADARVAAAVAQRYPRLSITGQLSSSGASTGDLFQTWLASLAGELAAPLLDGGQRRAEVTRTQAVVSQRVNEYGQAVLTALEDVENALVRERKQVESLASLHRQLTVSGETLDQLRSRYIGGNEDFLSVLSATVIHQSLQRTTLQANRQLMEYRIALYRALAGAWALERPPAKPAGDS